MTINTRSGRIGVITDPAFDDPALPIIQFYPPPPPPQLPPPVVYNASWPFYAAQQGITGQ